MYIFQNVKTSLQKILNLGVRHGMNFNERKRSRIQNLMYAMALLIMIPVLMVINISEGDFREVLFISVASFLGVITWILNIKGYGQLSVYGISIVIILLTYVVSFSTNTQTGAPYGNLLVAIISILFIKNRVFRLVVLSVCMVSFLITNYHQLSENQFVPAEYFSVLLMLSLVFLSLIYYEGETHSYQKRIEEKNEILKSKNQVIKEQSESLIALQKEKHEHELKYKQRDIESVLTNNIIQIKFRNNIISELEMIKRRKSIKNELTKTVSKLKREAKAHEKLNLLSDNVKEADSALYHRLLQEHSSLTKSELEICAFVKIGLAAKEIALLRNTTDNTINVLKTRIRKKIGLESNSQLREYLMSL
ncbi:MAG: hypothetical protein ABJG41_03875 [Cyclobacteriaceae bacterium]